MLGQETLAAGMSALVSRIVTHQLPKLASKSAMIPVLVETVPRFRHRQSLRQR